MTVPSQVHGFQQTDNGVTLQSPWWRVECHQGSQMEKENPRGMILEHPHPFQKFVSLQLS